MSESIVVFRVRMPAVAAAAGALRPVLDTPESAQLYEAMTLDLLERFGRLDSPGYTVGAAIDPPGGREWLERVTPRNIRIFLQRGNDDSARFENLFEDLFFEGFGPVALVNADVPTIPREAVESLLASPVVAGFDRQGGIWGFGLRAAAPTIFTMPANARNPARRIVENLRKLNLTFLRAPQWSGVACAEDLAELSLKLSDPSARAMAPRTTLAAERLGLVGS